MDSTPIVTTALIAAASVASAWITHRRGRRRQARREVDLQAELITKITAEAANRVSHIYSEMMEELRADAAGAREEARQARIIARQAETRAAEAEVAAEGAEREMRAMARFLRELRPLIEAHVPQPEALLAKVDRFAATARH